MSSVNLEHYDAWSKNGLFLKDIAEMLDNVLQFFIDNAPDQVARAKFSASRERSIGVGALGFHAYLQQKNLPWESAMAKGTNLRMFKHIRSNRYLFFLSKGFVAAIKILITIIKSAIKS